MRDLHFYFVLAIPSLLAASQQTQYITDIDPISSLAPCASSAVSYIVQKLTAKQCQSIPAALASCACTQCTNSASAVSDISTNVLQTQACGPTAHSGCVQRAYSLLCLLRRRDSSYFSRIVCVDSDSIYHRHNGDLLSGALCFLGRSRRY